MRASPERVRVDRTGPRYTRFVSVDDRFDELIGSITGFHRTWVVYLGLELGYLAALRAAGPRGLTRAELAAATATAPGPLADWLRAAHAFELVTLDGERAAIDEEIAVVLLDEDRPEHLGGQVAKAVISSMDWEALPGFLRTGVPVPSRPDRYRRSIERLTLQDIAVFFVEVLGSMPELTARLAMGGRVLDVHCGGGRWLVAMAKRFPRLELVGVEAQADSVARAVENVRDAGLAARIAIESGEPRAYARTGEFTLAYLQFALHDVADPAGTLAAAWRALAPGGRLLVLDWCLPSDPEDDRTPLGQLMWGAQLDQAMAGWSFHSREGFLELFAAAGIPAPAAIELPSGATAFTVERPA